MLVLSRKLNESIIIGKDITITVLSVGRSGVKLGITAPPDVKILREEVEGRGARAPRPSEEPAGPSVREAEGEHPPDRGVWPQPGKASLRGGPVPEPSLARTPPALTFDLDTDAPREPAGGVHVGVYINPLAVVSVREAERRAFAGPRRVAVLTLSAGQELTVCDPACTAAEVVRRAREAAEARSREEREAARTG